MFKQYLVISSDCDSFFSIKEFSSLSDAQDFVVDNPDYYGIFCLVNSNG